MGAAGGLEKLIGCRLVEDGQYQVGDDDDDDDNEDEDWGWRTGI